jgi:carbon monoxide dehydrogenase subunit G
MELTGERLIPQQRTWDALNDPEVLRACIAGCGTLERDGDSALNATMAVRVGPLSARFKGRLQLSNAQPPSRGTIHFDGQGGVAGFCRGSADVTLASADAETKLSYVARHRGRQDRAGQLAPGGRGRGQGGAGLLSGLREPAGGRGPRRGGGRSPRTASACLAGGVPAWAWAAGTAVLLRWTASTCRC